MQNKDSKGMTIKKNEDFSEWYQELIIKSGLADYSAVSGCIVYKPGSYQIWEKIIHIIDKEFKNIGIKNCYFPLFIPEENFNLEKEHVEGFVPEVAWVTHSGNSKLNERLAVRPTSEAIMYDSYSKWIRSHKDLPLKLNQWNNVVRWEFKHPVPFLRGREFLWNEGHNAYSNPEELNEDKEKILNIYYNFLKDYMALASFIGKKTNKEKFAGAVATYSIELLLPNGRAIQGPDYHDDGQNFAKAYNIKFLDENSKEDYVYQSTYAISTRMLGVMFAIHSDDKGLVLPPRLSENKIVIIPILFEQSKKEVLQKSNELKKLLQEYNPILDEREDYTPGWKYNEWELKGIPLRLEIGPRDLEKNQVVLVLRHSGEKKIVNINKLEEEIPLLLDKMHNDLYENSKKFLESNIKEVKNFKEFSDAIKDKKIVKINWCDRTECEEQIKEKLEGVKSLNIDLEKNPLYGEMCANCGNEAKVICRFGRSY